FGLVAYRLYYETFEKRGSDAGVRGIAFFFGIAFIIEVLIILQFGVDQRSVTATYVGQAWRIGEVRIPFRLLVAFLVAAALTVLLTLYLSRTFMGRAIRAVAQDQEALRLMGPNPIRIKQWAFGFATAVLGIAGALLIIVAPVEPTLGRTYLGRTFCVVVMAGLGSINGTLFAALILRVAQTILPTIFCASLAPPPSFSVLLSGLPLPPPPLLPPPPSNLTAPPSPRRSPDSARHRQPIPLLCRLRDPAIHRTRRRMEHPRRLCGVRQFRYQRVLRRGRLCVRISGQGLWRAAGRADRNRSRHRR